MDFSSLTLPSGKIMALTSNFVSLLILSLSFQLSHLLASGTCNNDEEAGLLGFKSGVTEDLSGMLSNWKPGTDCCKWSGVTCLLNNRVTALYLSGQPENPKSYLSGTISNSISKLRDLDGLYLLNLNNITGTFPKLLFNLPKLVFVYIENAKLSGPIPNDIGRISQLEALSLAGNRFSGGIPASIANIRNLTQLNLGRNLLTGGIPAGVQQLKKLTLLTLEKNQLSGKIPNFSSLSNLLVLRLSHNRLSGQIPTTLSNLAPHLTYLELGHNYLTGKIPDFLGNFKTLDTLDLSSNRFSGVVPTSFTNLTKIFNLDLSSNDLTDTFPQLNVKGIESLDLSHNKFNLGKIPNWVTSSPIIYSLKLTKCGIKMKLDDWKPAETYFYDYIDLSDNQISGSPLKLLNQTEYLVGFWGSRNMLKFNMTDLRFPKTLKSLDLSKNLVFGKLTSGISKLRELNVSYNHLCGQIPTNKFPASVFYGNDCLCGAPLTPCRKKL